MENKPNSILKLPRLWYSEANVYQSKRCECDCACPNPVLVEVQQRIRDSISVVRNSRHVRNIQLSPDLYTRCLPEIGAFSLLGIQGSGILVIDSFWRDLFPFFQRSISMTELKQGFRQWPIDILENILGILLTYDVLRSPDINIYQTSETEKVLSAWLSLTHRCNSSCSYCFITKGQEKMDEAMAAKSVDAVFRSALSYGYSRVKLKYAGGEPTLNFAALKVAQEHAEAWMQDSSINLETVLLTNGLYLPDDFIDYLINHDIGVLVSLDGLGSYHDNQRRAKNRNLSANAVLETIERLTQRGISSFISVTITPQNIDGLPQLVEYLLEKELYFGFNFYRDPGLGNSSVQQVDHNLLIDGLLKTFEVIKQQTPRFSLLSSLADRADLRFSHQRACGAGENYIVVSPDGKICNCQMEMQFPITTFDHENPLAVLRSDESRLKNLHVDQKDGCRECVWRYRCGGGCPREAYHAYGSFDSKSPLCDVYQAIFPEIIELEALRLLKYEKPWEYRIQ